MGRQEEDEAGLFDVRRRRAPVAAGHGWCPVLLPRTAWHLVPPVVAAALLLAGLALWPGQAGAGWQVGHQ